MNPSGAKKGLAITLAMGATVGLAWIFRGALAEFASGLWGLVNDRQGLQARIAAAGAGAPVVFILVQTAQVLLAPIPGEATGFIGGYLFGVFPGFLYSTLGLTLGSWMNLAIGRLLGQRYVRRWIPGPHLRRFDDALRGRGLTVVFLLFVFPGFPKDYLCLFLGLSDIPLRVLLALATVGRIPGTLMLSLQGALLFERNYWLLAIAFGTFLGVIGLFYCFRARFTRWVEGIESNPPDKGLKCR